MPSIAPPFRPGFCLFWSYTQSQDNRMHCEQVGCSLEQRSFRRLHDKHAGPSSPLAAPEMKASESGAVGSSICDGPWGSMPHSKILHLRRSNVTFPSRLSSYANAAEECGEPTLVAAIRYAVCFESALPFSHSSRPVNSVLDLVDVHCALAQRQYCVCLNRWWY